MAPTSPESASESKKPKGNFKVDILKYMDLIFCFVDTPFSQQQLPAWQPVLTAGTVFPAFFCIGVAFIAIGAPLLYFSNDVKEEILDYTKCNATDGNGKCFERNGTACTCEIPLILTEKWDGPVYMYYGLTNFYQNHRRYVKSRDEKQLLGNLGEPSKDCAPYEKDKDEKWIVPCGAIANSLFSGKLILNIILIEKHHN